ncbi:MAG: hypothetical protein OXL41_03980 [Nitrospinae bacterium]|nr:hypothetical protein [Nitrospinota bacterium]
MADKNDIVETEEEPAPEAETETELSDEENALQEFLADDLDEEPDQLEPDEKEEAETAPAEETVVATPAEETDKASVESDAESKAATEDKPASEQKTLTETLADILTPKAEEQSSEESKPESSESEVRPSPEPQQQQPVEAPQQAQSQETQQPTQDDAIEAARLEYGERIADFYGSLMTEELVEELQTSPETFMPKMAARMHLDIMDAVKQEIASSMPALMRQYSETETARSEAEDNFFAFWDQQGADLRPYRQDLERLSAAYRAVNPGASIEEFTRSVGAQVIVTNAGAFQKLASAQEEPQTNKPSFSSAAAASGQSGVIAGTQARTGYDALDFELFEDSPDD